MKKIFSLALMLTFTSISLQTYAQDPYSRGVPWEVFVIKNNGALPFGGYPNAPIEVILTYKSAQGTNYYQERFMTNLDEHSRLKLLIGEGQEIGGIYGIENLPFRAVKSLCYELMVFTLDGPVTITGEHLVGAVPSSIISQSANSANGIANRRWEEEPYPPIVVLDLPDDVTASFVIDSKETDPTGVRNALRRMPLRDLFSKHQAPSAVSAGLLDYISVFSGLGLPLSFSREELEELENYFTFCVSELLDYFNAFGVVVKENHAPALNHATAAIYGENIFDPLGVGIFANGAVRGSYNQGQTGMLGLTVGTGNGAGSWSRVATAPAAGGFKYGAFAEDQGLANSWAAAIFGNGFYTGTWMQSSDRRLKTEIRSQTNGLEQIMKLRPSQYRYIEGTPYGLPKGVHHGFIAQEMEEVLPELVSDITMPTDLDPDKMSSSETVQYKAINYIELIPILTTAIQELNAKVDAQAAEIESLKVLIQSGKGPK